MVGEGYDGLSDKERYERAIGEYAVTEEDAQLDEEGAVLIANIVPSIFGKREDLYSSDHISKYTSENFPHTVLYLRNGYGKVVYGDPEEMKEKIDKEFDRYRGGGWVFYRPFKIEKLSKAKEIGKIGSFVPYERIRYPNIEEYYEEWLIEPEIAKAYIDSMTRGLPSLEREVAELIKLLVEEEQRFLQERYKNKEYYPRSSWFTDPFNSQPQLTKIEEELIEPIKKYGESFTHK